MSFVETSLETYQPFHDLMNCPSRPLFKNGYPASSQNQKPSSSNASPSPTKQTSVGVFS